MRRTVPGDRVKIGSPRIIVGRPDAKRFRFLGKPRIKVKIFVDVQKSNVRFAG
jgi:hypothetical protein